MRMETSRLFLREMTSDDFSALYEVLADSDIMQHYPYTFDESRVRRWIDRNIERYETDGFCGYIAGLLSLNFGNGSLIKIGGVTLRGLISSDYGYNIKSITAALSGWMVICAGEAVLAKFAEVYFKNELTAGTPFTLAGAKEMLCRCGAELTENGKCE